MTTEVLDPETAEEESVVVSGKRVFLTDLGNAQKFVDECGQNIRYVAEGKQWFIWNGTYWEPDVTERIMKMAEDVVRGFYAEAARIRNSAERAKWIKHALRSEDYTNMKHMIAYAQHQGEVPAELKEFDRDPWLLNVQNGTIDLRDGSIRDHAQADMIHRIVKVNYDRTLDAETACPNWLAFLRRILLGREEFVTFLQQGLGYSLTGVLDAHAFFVMVGSGHNGKSTLMRTIYKMLGGDDDGIADPYAAHTTTTTVMAKGRDDGIPNDMAALRGKRFIYTMETREGRALDEERIKAMSGGDPQTNRFLHREFATSFFTGKVWVGSNFLPVIKGSDRAIWDRVKLVPFDYRFPKDGEENTDPTFKKLSDSEVDAMFEAEYPGILTWLVRGCIDWYKSPAHELKSPAALVAGLDAYRTSMDIVNQWVQESCEDRRGQQDGERRIVTATQSLYEHFKRGHRDTEISIMSFSLKLAALGFVKTPNGRKSEFYDIRLIDDAPGF